MSTKSNTLSRNWPVSPLKYLATLVTGSTPPKSDSANYEENGIPWIKPDDLNGLIPVETSEERLSAMGESISRVVPAGAALVCCIGTVGKIGIAGTRLATNQQINSVVFDRPKMLSARFGVFALMSSEQEHIRCANKVVVAILNKSGQGNISIPAPPIPDQHRIAAYLDEQTAKIDRLMEMRRRQMALLKEQRAALIQQAVTRGLDPNAPMKDSGLTWLGDIPAHWKSVSLGYLATLLQTGPFGSQLHAQEYVEGGIPVINPSHMGDGLIRPDSKCTVDEATAKRLSRHFLQIGDVVFARRGELGRCALVRAEEKGWLCGTGSLLMRPEIRMIEPAYLVALFTLKRLKESLAIQSVGSTMDNLNTGILSCTGLPLPPLCEQVEILDFIEKQREKLDSLQASYTRQLTLLAEYRAALIHECVTGQRAVPEVYYA